MYAKWCCTWTVCEHAALLAYVFSPEYQVPGKLVVETPALRKKNNSIRGTAGLKLKLLMKEIAKQIRLAEEAVDEQAGVHHDGSASAPAEAPTGCRGGATTGKGGRPAIGGRGGPTSGEVCPDRARISV
jgi:hypothetical protein